MYTTNTIYGVLIFFLTLVRYKRLKFYLFLKLCTQDMTENISQIGYEVY